MYQYVLLLVVVLLLSHQQEQGARPIIFDERTNLKFVDRRDRNSHTVTVYIIQYFPMCLALVDRRTIMAMYYDTHLLSADATIRMILLRFRLYATRVGSHPNSVATLMRFGRTVASRQTRESFILVVAWFSFRTTSWLLCI
jgi:hypothetical protein